MHVGSSQLSFETHLFVYTGLRIMYFVSTKWWVWSTTKTKEGRRLKCFPINHTLKLRCTYSLMCVTDNHLHCWVYFVSIRGNFFLFRWLGSKLVFWQMIVNVPFTTIGFPTQNSTSILHFHHHFNRYLLLEGVDVTWNVFLPRFLILPGVLFAEWKFCSSLHMT